MKIFRSITLLLILSGVSYSQTVQTPTPVRIMGDAYTSVSTTGGGVHVSLGGADQSVTVTTQDIFHYQTHQGHRYSLVTHQTITGSGTFYVLITAPAVTLTHFQWSAESTNEAHVHFYESPVASGGTPYFTPNRNRNSANAASLLVSSGPTVTSTGTLLSAHNLITGKNQGGSTVGDEWILKASTLYLFEFINLSVQAIEMDFEFRWSEFNM